MKKTWLRLCRAYLLIMLLAASVALGLPYSMFALALLLAALFTTLRTLPPRLELATNVSLVFLAPLVAGPFWGYLTQLPAGTVAIAAAVSTLPLMFLLDNSLRRYARYVIPSAGLREGRRPSHTALALLVAALVMLLISFILSNRALFLTATLFVLYLGATLLRVLLAVPPHPVEATLVRRRVIAGGTLSIDQQVASRAAIGLHAQVRPVESYLKVTPQRFPLGRGKTALNLTITPPLAGPSRPQLRVSTLDPWGLVHFEQIVEPVELHVIPRARYASWLATRYLERTTTGAVEATTTTLPPVAAFLKRGTEYYDSRAYNPGDPLRDIDWKHTAKLNRLIVKEYIESGKQSAIIAVNLTVSDSEAADRLAFRLITAALTLAEEGVPTGLAAYNHRSVLLTLPITDPREALEEALRLVKNIDTVELAHRHLELPDFDRLRRSIGLLKRAQSEPARRLLGLLDFEYRATERATRGHPATLALSSVAERAPAPAMVLLVTQMNHDAEAIRVATDRLSKRDFTFIPVDGG